MGNVPATEPVTPYVEVDILKSDSSSFEEKEINSKEATFMPEGTPSPMLTPSVSTEEPAQFLESALFLPEIDICWNRNNLQMILSPENSVYDIHPAQFAVFEGESEEDS